MNLNSIQPECSNCVYFDADEKNCSRWNEIVESNDICDSYEQDEEPEPIKVKTHRKRHLED